MRRWLGGLQAALDAEQDRWFLWLPVAFGFGVALYFFVPLEPALPATAAIVATSVLIAVVLRDRPLASIVAVAVVATAAGFAMAKLRSDRVAAPIIDGRISNVRVTGWIELVEPRAARGQRLTIRVAEMDKLQPDAWPRRVRVRTLVADDTLRAGDAVRLRATLSQPAGPALPGGYDFARSAWFLGLGGVGYTRESPVRVELAEPMPLDLRVRAGVERVRQFIGDRIMAVLPNETGAIANALITGERGAISDATNDAFRDSGLFHILSISGLHMVIMAGAVFMSVRVLLTLVPTLALRYPIKKWAAATAAIGALGYLLISGMSPPTVRSYLMISIMFLAVLLDRPAVALRNVALSALIIMIVAPESLIDVGFQMSYAAVVGLVAAYEMVRAHEEQRAGRGRSRNMLMALLLFFGGIVLSTLIASFTVAPFAAYHFHKSQQYAVLANLIAIPICNIIVMPAALAVLVAIPLGLEYVPLLVMAWGIDAMVWCAYKVAALPGSVGYLPEFSTRAFALMLGGGLWLCLWRRRWRLLGLLPIFLGLALAPLRAPPDVMVGRDGRLVAARDTAGRLSALGEAGSAFELARWLEHDGDSRPVAEVARGDAFRCDAVGCTVRVRGRVVSIVRHAAAFADECAAADVIVTTMTKPPRCGRRALVIDGAVLRKGGALSLTMGAEDAIHVRAVLAERGQRPWGGNAALSAPAGDPSWTPDNRRSGSNSGSTADFRTGGEPAADAPRQMPFPSARDLQADD